MKVLGMGEGCNGGWAEIGGCRGGWVRTGGFNGGCVGTGGCNGEWAGTGGFNGGCVGTTGVWPGGLTGTGAGTRVEEASWSKRSNIARVMAIFLCNIM
jgi:hypothetical protein